MSFQNKYLKYKQKYLNLKSQSGGAGGPVGTIMSKVINPINGKEYFYKTQDEFGDDVYTRGPLTITDEYVNNQGGVGYYNTIYTINNVNVRDNIWLQKPLEPKPPEWAIMRKVINPINGKEYFYKTQDEFNDDVYTRGALTITTEYYQERHYSPGYHNTIHTINGVNVIDNIWLPKP